MAAVQDGDGTLLPLSPLLLLLPALELTPELLEFSAVSAAPCDAAASPCAAPPLCATVRPPCRSPFPCCVPRQDDDDDDIPLPMMRKGRKDDARAAPPVVPKAPMIGMTHPILFECVFQLIHPIEHETGGT